MVANRPGSCIFSPKIQFQALPSTGTLTQVYSHYGWLQISFSSFYTGVFVLRKSRKLIYKQSSLDPITSSTTLTVNCNYDEWWSRSGITCKNLAPCSCKTNRLWKLSGRDVMVSVRPQVNWVLQTLKKNLSFKSGMFEEGLVFRRTLSLTAPRFTFWNNI